MIALKEAGCSVVFQEQVSTRVKEENRPQFQAALSSLESGDELVVAKLDRLGRTQVEVVSRLHRLQEEGIHVRTLVGWFNQRTGKVRPRPDWVAVWVGKWNSPSSTRGSRSQSLTAKQRGNLEVAQRPTRQRSA